MTDLPGYISLTFIGCVVATASFLYFGFDKAGRASGKNLNFKVIGVIALLILGVSFLSMSGFLLNFESRPPRLFMILAPILVFTVMLVSLKKTRVVLLKIPISTLTYLHIIRIPVEVVLWWLFLFGKVPEAMTFEGMNYDILSGITAPFAAIFLVGHRVNNRIGAIVWNFAALILLFNIVIRAVLASPYFYSPELFETPNVGVLYFPFILLPAFIVPVVLFCHLVSLIQLFSKKEDY